MQPFDNTVDLVTMSGAGIKASLEAAAASINHTDPSIYPGFGYQLSGLKVTFTVLEDNIGDRVTSLQMETPEGDYVDVDPETVKLIDIIQFLDPVGSLVSTLWVVGSGLLVTLFLNL